MTKNKVYITGAGMVSALGLDVESNFQSLKAGKSGIGKPQHLPTLHRDSFVLGEIDLSNKALADLAGVKYYDALSRTALLGYIAAKEAVKNAGLTADELSHTGLINATSVGGMDITENHYNPDKPLSGKEMFYYYSGHDCGHCATYIGKNLHLGGKRTTISTACSSSANSIMTAVRWINAGICDRVIAGGTDALSVFTLNGFNALMILDNEWCRPFDQTRAGLNLGEGAAYVVLESEAAANERNANKLGVVSGYANANDAYHQTASSPEGKGALAAINQALKVAQLSPQDISYINAHGTGTQNNDLSEGIALNTLFGEYKTPFSSTKAYTGHTLAAAGAIEAVISLLNLREQMAFPNLNCTHPAQEYQSPILANTELNLNHIVSNSFGFGGNCSTLILSQCN